MTNLRFSRIKLENWRNFVKVDVPLSQRVFVVGPNASGKSNFLDAFRFLHDIARPRGGLRDACDERGEMTGIRNSEARRNKVVSIEVEISSDKAPAWKYRIELDNRTRSESHALVKRETVSDWHDGSWVQVKQQEASGLGNQTFLEQDLANRDFTELHTFLADLRYRHLVPQLVREPNATFPGQDPFGRSLLQRMAETPTKRRDARIRRIGVALANSVPGLVGLEWDPGQRSNVPHIVARFEHWRPGDVRRNERVLSDGTLRLIGILWELLDTQSVLLLEEPELSLHEQLVCELPRLFARVARSRTGRRPLQTIVSTHAARMFDDEGIGLDEVLLVIPDPAKAISTVRSAADIEEIQFLVAEQGVQLRDVVQARTAPGQAGQLVLDLGA